MTNARTTDGAASGEETARPLPRGSGLSRIVPLRGVPGGRALLLLCAATGVLALSFAVALVDAIVRAASAGPPAQPSVESRFRWRAPPEVRLAGDGPAAADAPAASAPETPDVAGTVVRWREEEKLRRVAGILLLDGDYEGAIEMLLQIKGEDSRAFALDRAAHARILGGLRPALLREREALRVFLDGLPASERELALLRPQGERLLALPPEDLHLPDCAEALPERVALCFMRNVHVRLCRETPGSDSLVGLVLGLGFRQGSDAARVYRDEFPTEYTSYTDALPAPPGEPGGETTGAGRGAGLRRAARLGPPKSEGASARQAGGDSRAGPRSE